MLGMALSKIVSIDSIERSNTLAVTNHSPLNRTTPAARTPSIRVRPADHRGVKASSPSGRPRFVIVQEPRAQVIGAQAALDRDRPETLPRDQRRRRPGCRHDFTDPGRDTRFLGDLYQDLSQLARKRYALLQTPEFVEEFILDRTLEPRRVRPRPPWKPRTAYVEPSEEKGRSRWEGASGALHVELCRAIRRVLWDGDVPVTLTHRARERLERVRDELRWVEPRARPSSARTAR
jgi:hypothetical protein